MKPAKYRIDQTGAVFQWSKAANTYLFCGHKNMMCRSQMAPIKRRMKADREAGCSA